MSIFNHDPFKPDIRKTLTPKQEGFAKAYAQNKEIVTAALTAGYSDSYAAKKAYILLQNPLVKQKIKEFEKEYLSQRFSKLADTAINTLEDILTDSSVNSNAKLKAVDKVFELYESDKANKKSDETPRSGFLF